jgi:hypothetical protein
VSYPYSLNVRSGIAGSDVLTQKRAGESAKRFTEFSKVCRSMKIGFICPNRPGHLNPMTALARLSIGDQLDPQQI